MVDVVRVCFLFCFVVDDDDVVVVVVFCLRESKLWRLGPLS